MVLDCGREEPAVESYFFEDQNKPIFARPLDQGQYGNRQRRVSVGARLTRGKLEDMEGSTVVMSITALGWKFIGGMASCEVQCSNCLKLECFFF